MKKIAILLFWLAAAFSGSAQSKWFSTYTDSAALVRDGNRIVQQMAARVQSLRPEWRLDKNIAIKNTTPYLIYIDSLTVNLPFWVEVIPPQQAFFEEVTGSKTAGYEAFGLFFNGFYIAHEMGHSIAALAGRDFKDAYSSEYDANTIGILYWRSIGEQKMLAKCYEYARRILGHLQNPVPAGVDAKQYITEHYMELAADPYKYGYIQFSQFVEIYENRQLPDFTAFIKNYKS